MIIEYRIVQMEFVCDTCGERMMITDSTKREVTTKAKSKCWKIQKYGKVTCAKCRWSSEVT